MWTTINCGKLFKRWEYQTTLPHSWEICIQVKKQQLQLAMEQETAYFPTENDLQEIDKIEQEYLDPAFISRLW